MFEGVSRKSDGAKNNKKKKLLRAPVLYPYAETLADRHTTTLEIIRHCRPFLSHTTKLRDCIFSSPWARFGGTVQPLKHVRRSHSGFCFEPSSFRRQLRQFANWTTSEFPCLRVPNQTPEWGISAHPAVTHRNITGPLPGCGAVRCARFTAPSVPPKDMG